MGMVGGHRSIGAHAYNAYPIADNNEQMKGNRWMQTDQCKRIDGNRSMKTGRQEQINREHHCKQISENRLLWTDYWLETPSGWEH